MPGKPDVYWGCGYFPFLTEHNLTNFPEICHDNYSTFFRNFHGFLERIGQFIGQLKRWVLLVNMGNMADEKEQGMITAASKVSGRQWGIETKVD